jgi:acetolactate decarboxylase
MMHRGDIGAKQALAELAEQPHVYALGAVAGLKGEILVLDSQPWISRVDTTNHVQLSQDWQVQATLLVRTTVAAWDTLPLPEDIHTQAHLVATLPSLAANQGLDTTAAFPFRLIGTAMEVGWHVIDWPAGDRVHTHAKHQAASLRGRLQGEPMEILGFYSQVHQGIFTHHGQPTHLHVLARSRAVAGHVDDLTLHGNTYLLLPRRP